MLSDFLVDYGRVLSEVRHLCVQLSRFAGRDFAELPDEDCMTIGRCLDLLVGMGNSVPMTWVNALVREPDIMTHRDNLCCLRAWYEVRQERYYAERILADHDPVAAMGRYMNDSLPQTVMHSRDFQNLIKDRMSCLVIGAGPLPSTAILLSQLSHLQVTCIDNDRACAALGRQVLSSAKIERVEYLCCDGLDLADLRRWDVVLVTIQAGVHWATGSLAPRSALIEHVASTVCPGSILLLRSAHALGNLYHADSYIGNLVGFKISTISSPVPGRSGLIVAEKMENRYV